MKKTATFLTPLLVAPTMARRNMRSLLYRVDLGLDIPRTRAGFTDQTWRQLASENDMPMPIDAEFSMPLDTDMSFPLDTDMSMPSEAMSMPYTCDSTFTCPDSCDCGGNVQDGGDICGCYSITSVQPPFDTSVAPANGTWYCYQVDLDKSVDGCSGAAAVSHSVLATGFSDSCLFHPGGIDVDGSDDWFDVTCDNSAATGLKYDFGQSGGGDQLSVTYCFDVSCEAAPKGEGSISWVLKAANDRCEIEVTEGAIPNCGVSSDLCHPSCPADDGNNKNNKGKLNDETETEEIPAGVIESNDTKASKGVSIGAAIGAVAAVTVIAGVTYKLMAKKNADAASLSSADTSLA